MNTRLQVEHPVTEEVYGVDLVALQLAIAEGEPLPFARTTSRPRGHAIEVRLYAEDPAQDDRPAPGAVHRYAHDDDLRWEDALGTSGEISAHYDPMIAKVIAHAPTRTAAARRLAAGLAARGDPRPGHQPRPARRRAPRRRLPRRGHAHRLPRPPPRPAHAPARDPARSSTSPPRSPHDGGAPARDDPRALLAPPGWRLLRGAPRSTARWAGPDGEVAVGLPAAPATPSSSPSTAPTTCSACATPPRTARRVTHGGVEYRCRVAHHDGETWVDDTEGHSAWREVPRLPAPDAAVAGAGPVARSRAPSSRSSCAAGDEVRAGQKLVVLEAMKMEHPALAAADGVVETVHVTSASTSRRTPRW